MERYFVLKVDLSEVLEDVCHQKVMILVDPQWSTVAEVRNKIRKMFEIKTKIGFKSLDGFFVPLEEPVEILKYVNMLIAFKAAGESESEEQVEKKTSRSIIEPEIITTAEFASKKKRKHNFLNDENFTTSTPNVAKRSKNISSPPVELSPLIEENRSKKKAKTITPDKALHESHRKSTKSLSKQKSKSIRNSETENSKTENHIFFESNQVQEVQENNSESNSLTEKIADEEKKSKMEIVFLCELTDSEPFGRGRSFQIGKPTNGTAAASHTESHVNSENEQSHGSMVSKSTLVGQASSYMAMEKSNSAIDDSVDSKGSCLEQSTKLSMSCDESAVIDLIETDGNESQSQINLTSQQDVECSTVNGTNADRSSVNGTKAECSSVNGTNAECLSVNATNAECSSINGTNAEYSSVNASNMECSDASGSNVECSSVNETNIECSSLNETSTFEPNECSPIVSTKTIPLTDLPNLKDRLIFKIMLSNNKLSDYFFGICEYVNKRTKSIKIHLTDGHSQLRYLPQKFAGNIDDSNGISIINVKLQDMFDPKVLQT